MKQATPVHPSQLAVGDRITRSGSGAVVIVDAIEETPDSWKIDFTYEDARVTSGFCFVSKDARHALPIRRYE